jgi:penicillin amidase
MTKLIGLIDMTETQGWMEKLIVQMLQSGVSLEQLRELFPYLTDEPDDGFLEIIRKVKLVDPLVPEAVPWTSVAKMKASNNWVVSGDRTASGKPILCGDPHLDDLARDAGPLRRLLVRGLHRPRHTYPRAGAHR